MNVEVMFFDFTQKEEGIPTAIQRNFQATIGYVDTEWFRKINQALSMGLVPISVWEKLREVKRYNPCPVSIMTEEAYRQLPDQLKKQVLRPTPITEMVASIGDKAWEFLQQSQQRYL